MDDPQDIPPPTTNRPSLSPLEIPEILVQILLLVEEHTLRRSVPFVCRQWLAIARHHILRTVRWDYQDDVSSADPEDRFKRLAFASRLEVQYSAHNGSWVTYNRMNRAILQAMDPSLPAEPKPIYDQQQWKEIQAWEASEKQFLEGPLLLLRKRPLRQLSLGGWDSSDAIRRISQHMGTLTHVEAMIGHVGRWSSVVDSFLFDAGIVIKNCPLLQYFKMSSVSLNFAPLVIGPWVPAVSELDAPFCCRHLETLILQGLVFKSQELKDLLSVSPNLKVLKVINRRSRTPDGTWGGHSYNAYRDLLQHLERVGLVSCTNLDILEETFLNI